MTVTQPIKPRNRNRFQFKRNVLTSCIKLSEPRRCVYNMTAIIAVVAKCTVCNSIDNNCHSYWNPFHSVLHIPVYCNHWSIIAHVQSSIYHTEPCICCWQSMLSFITWNTDLVIPISKGTMIITNGPFRLMMTSSNGNIFRVTGRLCGEFTRHRWILRTRASNKEVLCFL